MTSKTITAIALKVFAIWLLFNLVLNLPGIWSIFQNQQQWLGSVTFSNHWPYLVAFTILIIGLIIAFLIFRLANSVLSSLPGEQGSSNQATNLESFSFQVLGAYFVVSSLAYLPAQFVSANLNAALDDQPQLLVYRLYLLASLFKIFVGIFFILKASTIGALFKKFRYYSVQPYNK